MAGSPRRAPQARRQPRGAERRDQEKAPRASMGSGREEVRVRHRERQEDPGRALRRALTAARLQHHVRPRLHDRRVPWLHQLGRRARRLARSHEPPRRDADLFFAGACGAADGLQAANGLAVSLRLTYNSDFAFDFGLALTEEQAQQIPEIIDTIDNPPEWLEEWSRQVGAELKD